MAKRKPTNPNGRKGCKEHQDLIQKIKNYLEKKGLIPDTENEVIIDNDKKRYMDVAGLNENDEVEEFHQVGLQNKNGEPVARERKVMDEVEKATGKRPIFHPYNIISAIVVLFGLYQFFKNLF